MNPFKKIDNFIGLKLYPLQVKMDAKSYRAYGFTEPEALSKIIYNKRSKMWKSYGIKLEDISKVVYEYYRIKPLHGLALRIDLIKAKSAIRTAIKQKRIVFIGENKAEYTDRGFSKFKVSFAELADIFIRKVEKGFTIEMIVKILEEEYKKGEMIKNATRPVRH